MDKNYFDNTNDSATGINSLPHACNIDLEKLKQLQQQDEYKMKLIYKCKSTKSKVTPYYLDEHGITYRKITNGPNIFHTVMIPNALQLYILYESHNALGHHGSTRMYHII